MVGNKAGSGVWKCVMAERKCTCIQSQNKCMSELWEVRSYRSHDAEGWGVIHRVQDVALTCVLRPHIGTGVVLEFRSVGVPEWSKGWSELT